MTAADAGSFRANQGQIAADMARAISSGSSERPRSIRRVGRSFTRRAGDAIERR